MNILYCICFQQNKEKKNGKKRNTTLTKSCLVGDEVGSIEGTTVGA
jgi:hypothetical protein